MMEFNPCKHEVMHSEQFHTGQIYAINGRALFLTENVNIGVQILRSLKEVAQVDNDREETMLHFIT